MLTPKNAKATAILAIMCDLDVEAFEGHVAFTIEPYLNGREDGFAVVNNEARETTDGGTVYGRKVVFSENRNSDNIVVYTGPSWAFSMQGNSPDDSVYETKKYFDPDGYVAAARYALSFLNGKNIQDA